MNRPFGPLSLTLSPQGGAREKHALSPQACRGENIL